MRKPHRQHFGKNFDKEQHPAMSMADRAAQFGSFAALSGFEQAIEETARRHIQAQDAAGKEPADAEPDLYCD